MLKLDMAYSIYGKIKICYGSNVLVLMMDIRRRHYRIRIHFITKSN
ncbi:MAG: hypothetical protein ACI94Y_002803 [Maribacter sp.]|jgi:hypothetical protein